MYERRVQMRGRDDLPNDVVTKSHGKLDELRHPSVNAREWTKFVKEHKKSLFELAKQCYDGQPNIPCAVCGKKFHTKAAAEHAQMEHEAW